MNKTCIKRLVCVLAAVMGVTGCTGNDISDSEQISTSQSGVATFSDDGGNNTKENEQCVNGAFMIDGALYVSGEVDDSLTVIRVADELGQAVNDKYVDVAASGATSKNVGFKQYVLYEEVDAGNFKGMDRIPFPDGKYEISLDGEIFPVVSVVEYAVDSGNLTDDGKPMPFCDYVYPIVYNASAYDNISIICEGTYESLDFQKWPKILLDGNSENPEGGQKIQITYPKPENSDEPKVYEDIPTDEPNGKYSLDHKDKLTVIIDGDRADTFYWDQIAKTWFSDTTSEYAIDMEYIEGGTYVQGDWRNENDEEYLYTITYGFGGANANILRMWNNILDPQFMNEIKVGADAVGVTGLKSENSTASDIYCPMWSLNDASADVHNVTVSDFMLGKYEVTMEQFYDFVDACVIKNEDPAIAAYEINGTEYTLDEVSSYAIICKKDTVKDNGWGVDSRPAIDICWHEAVQFCNYRSLKDGFEPCYTFTNIYDGKEGNGRTKVSVLPCVSGSDMQKGAKIVKEIQLVRVDCDFNKNGYRLPTEAEYEYAARGGKYINSCNNGHGSLFAGLSTSSTVSEPEDYTEGFNDHAEYYAWVNLSTDNPKKSGVNKSPLTSEGAGGNAYSGPVGSKLPNQLGIYDLVGNVWEQQWDFYNRSYYQMLAENSENLDPRGPVYSNEQLSVMDDHPVDPSMKNEYVYSYKPDEENGGKTRVGAASLMYSGKLVHTLRGGSFSNPIGLANTINRFGPAQSYTQMYINFTDSRIGFRLARSVTEGEKAQRISNPDTRTEITSFAESFLYMINVPHIRESYANRIAGMFDKEAEITYDGERMSFDDFLTETEVSPENTVEIGNTMIYKNDDGSYTAETILYIMDEGQDTKKSSDVVKSRLRITENEYSEFAFEEAEIVTLRK